MVSMKKALVCLLLVIGSVAAAAQSGVIQGHCYQGGFKANTSGQLSANYLDGIIPGCTVTVYLTGSTMKASITTPTGGTLTNPFTANQVPGVDPGGWIFSSAINQGVDVVMSGGNNNPNCNVAPLCYTQPVTLVDVFPSQSFNPTSGVVSINMVQGAFTFTGNVSCTGASCNFLNGTTLQHNGTNLPDQALLNFLDAPASLNPPVSDTNVPVVFKNDTHGGLAAEVPPAPAGLQVTYATPAAGQFFFLRPSSCGYSATGSNPSGSGSCTNDNASGVLSGTNIGPVNQTNNQLVFGFTLPSFISQGNITAVYSAATFSFGGEGIISLNSATCSDGGSGVSNFASTGAGIKILQQSVNLYAHIPNVNATTCTYAVSGTGTASFGGGYIAAGASVGLFIFYTGTAPPASPSVISVCPPLYYQSGQLGLASPYNVAYDTTNTNSYVATVPAFSNACSPSQLFPGSEIILYPTNASTSTTPTLNLNGLGAITIQKSGNALVSGDMAANSPAVLEFDGSNFQLVNPIHGNGSGVSSTTNADGSLTITPTTGAVVASLNNGHANTWNATQSFAATLGFDASTAIQVKLPVAAGYASAANGEIGFDTTNKNWHLWGNGVDNILTLFPAASPPTNGNCAQWSVVSGVITLGQASSNCGPGSSGVSDGAGSTTANQIAVSTGSAHQIAYKDFPEHLIVPAANCNNATAGAGWSIPASNAPTVACRGGTNNLGGVLTWANNNTTTNAQFTIQLPFDWDTSVQPWINIIYSSGSNTSGTVKWTFSSACTKSDGSVTDDPAFNAESATTGKTMAVANRMWAESVQFTAITSGNNCIQGSPIIIKVTSGNGSATSTVSVEEVTITIPRQIVDQAN